jgi:ATP-binding cassette subfamily E protein 1
VNKKIFISSALCREVGFLRLKTASFATTAKPPESLLKGMNYFLRQMEVTLRSDPSTHRPRINKYNSVKDKAQKQNGTYYILKTQ